MARKLLAWYAEHARILPWRGSFDTYAIWISEIMLQQTRVETVIPYYERWMERFPTINSLSSSSQQEVLTLWEGLGYYHRARNLHKTAQIVVNQRNGELPQDVKSLVELPGIGPYTASAISSIAFGNDEPAVDGNIKRIFSRLFDISETVSTPKSERLIQKLFIDCLPSGQTGEFNQALMDLGSMVCTPKVPSCQICPLMELCKAYALGVQEERPVRKPKPRVPHHTCAAAVIINQRNVLIIQRPVEGLLGGLWKFPTVEIKEGESHEDCLKRQICEELDLNIVIDRYFGKYRHAYTHFRITLHAFYCVLGKNGAPIPKSAKTFQWIPYNALSEVPMGKVDRQIAKQLVSMGNAS